MMHYIKVEKNVGADAFSRMRFQNSSNSDVPPMDELYAITDDPPRAMAGPVCLKLMVLRIQRRGRCIGEKV